MVTNTELVVVTPTELSRLIDTAVTRAVEAVQAYKAPQVTPKPSEALTFDQVRARLKLSAPTVRKLLVEGHLRGIRAGTKWLVSTDEITRYLNGGR